MIFTHAFIHLNVQTGRELVMEQRIGTGSNAGKKPNIFPNHADAMPKVPKQNMRAIRGSRT